MSRDWMGSGTMGLGKEEDGNQTLAGRGGQKDLTGQCSAPLSGHLLVSVCPSHAGLYARQKDSG